jgi:anti-sigma-K factor RskA
MTCDQLKGEYELHSLGLLEDPEKTELEEHLRRGCSACILGLNQAMALNAGILALAPDVATGVVPSKRLRRRVLASIGSEKNWGWTGGWITIAAGLAIAVLWIGAQERQRTGELAVARQQIEKSGAEVAQIRQALSLLNQPETKQVIFGAGKPEPPRGRVFVNGQQGVLLLAGNLPAAPSGKIYELWVIPKGGAPKPAGLFQSDSNGNALYLSKGPVDMATTGAVAVTLEPESGSPGPTSTPLIVAPVAE